MSGEVGRRCSVCGITHPGTPKWKNCAQCGEPTDLINQAPTHTPEECTSILRHREFDEYLEDKTKEAVA